MNLGDLIDRLADVSASMMDSARPSDEHNTCPICCENATEARDHMDYCAYRIARTQLSPHDLKRVRRLARALREED